LTILSKNNIVAFAECSVFIGTHQELTSGDRNSSINCTAHADIFSKMKDT